MCPAASLGKSRPFQGCVVVVQEVRPPKPGYGFRLNRVGFRFMLSPPRVPSGGPGPSFDPLYEVRPARGTHTLSVLRELALRNRPGGSPGHPHLVDGFFSKRRSGSISGCRRGGPSASRAFWALARGNRESLRDVQPAPQPAVSRHWNCDEISGRLSPRACRYL